MDIEDWLVIAGSETMYNLTVQQDRTYTVGDGQFVVHNCPDGSGGGYSPGDQAAKGRTFSEHGAKRANARGFTDDNIDSIIDNRTRVKQIDDKGKATWHYQDRRGNTVVTDEFTERIVPVFSHPASLNNEMSIPKPGR